MNQEHPLYPYGRKWQEAIEKTQQIAESLDDLTGSSKEISWGDVANMTRVNELLDEILKFMGIARAD